MADGLAHWLHASQQKLMPLTLFGTTLLVWPQGGWCIPMRGPTTPSSPATASRMVTSAARYALDEGANRQRTSCPTTSSLQPKSRATGLESHGPTGVRVLGTLLRASAALVMMFPAVKTVLDTLPCITPSGTYNHPRTTPVRPTACCCGPCCFRPPPPPSCSRGKNQKTECGYCGGEGCGTRNGLAGYDCCNDVIDNSSGYWQDKWCSRAGRAPCHIDGERG